jgi:hypothetical protein
MQVRRPRLQEATPQAAASTRALLLLLQLLLRARAAAHAKLRHGQQDCAPSEAAIRADAVVVKMQA